MIKTYIEVYQAGVKKDGTPFRRLKIYAIDEKTGVLFELFNLGMTPLNLTIYETMLELERIKQAEPYNNE